TRWYLFCASIINNITSITHKMLSRYTTQVWILVKNRILLLNKLTKLIKAYNSLSALLSECNTTYRDFWSLFHPIPTILGYVYKFGYLTSHPIFNSFMVGCIILH